MSDDSDDEPVVENAKMALWNNYRPLSEDFLRQHHDLVLYDVFHQVVALLLCPPSCRCGEVSCQCDLLRKKINLSLNLDLFNFLQETYEDAEFFSGARLLLNMSTSKNLR